MHKNITRLLIYTILIGLFLLMLYTAANPGAGPVVWVAVVIAVPLLVVIVISDVIYKRRMSKIESLPQAEKQQALGHMTSKTVWTLLLLLALVFIFLGL